MSVSRNYGILRVVRLKQMSPENRVRKRQLLAANVQTELNEKYQAGRRVPAERFVHVLTRRETTIGRALGNDIMLFDPTVSREHARLVLDTQGWCVYNISEQNSVHVNGHSVPCGGCLPIKPQDYLRLGNVVVQLIAPHTNNSNAALESENATELVPLQPPPIIVTNGHKPAPVDTQELVSSDEDNASALPARTQSQTDAGMPTWHNSEENLWGAEETAPFALAQHLGIRKRWLFVIIGLSILSISAVGSIVLNNLLGISILAQNEPSSLLAALTIPLLPALGINLLVNIIDRFEREPLYLRVAAFLWGAIIAIPPSSLIERFVDSFISSRWGPGSMVLHSLLQGLNFGVTEETLKGLGLLLLFIVLRDEFDNVTDGIVYGALIGAGFAMVENFFYFMASPHDMLVLIVGRIVLGWLGHSTFTVCFGAALGYIRHTRQRWQHIIIPLLGFLLAVALHTSFDFINLFVKDLVSSYPNNGTVAVLSIIAVIGDYIPLFITQLTILYIVMKSLAHEAAIIREFLSSEVSAGTVSVDEYALLQHSFARTREERRMLRQRGFKQWQRVRALYQSEIGLAFRKWHVSMGDRPKPGYVQPEDHYRQRIQQLRQDIQGAEK